MTIMRSKSILLLLIMAMTGGTAYSQDNQLTVDVQLLTRGELRRGGLPEVNGVSEDKANFVFERTRLAIDYQRDYLEASIIAQHSGVWGQKGNGTLNIYGAWVKLKTGGWFAQLGRQELNYDDERILGRNDWAMAAQSHDALRLGYEGHRHKAHAIVAYNQKAENINGGTIYRTTDGDKPYKALQVGWYHYDLPRIPLGVSLLAMNAGLESPDGESPDMEWQQLFGGYVTFSPRHWKAEAAYYHQTGKDEFSTPVNAFMASGKLTWSPIPRFSLVGGYDYLSGDDNPQVPKKGLIGMSQHTEVNGFSTIYGSHHQFYGAMDFFYVRAYYGGYTPGLQNLYGGATFMPVKNLLLSARYHYMAVASKISEADRTLGRQVELEASYALSKDVQLAAGYSFMDGTATLERLQRIEGKDNLRWAWLMLTVNPRIFTTKW